MLSQYNVWYLAVDVNVSEILSEDTTICQHRASNKPDTAIIDPILT